MAIGVRNCAIGWRWKLVTSVQAIAVITCLSLALGLSLRTFSSELFSRRSAFEKAMLQFSRDLSSELITPLSEFRYLRTSLSIDGVTPGYIANLLELNLSSAILTGTGVGVRVQGADRNIFEHRYGAPITDRLPNGSFIVAGNRTEYWPLAVQFSKGAPAGADLFTLVPDSLSMFHLVGNGSVAISSSGLRPRQTAQTRMRILAAAAAYNFSSHTADWSTMCALHNDAPVTMMIYAGVDVSSAVEFVVQRIDGLNSRGGISSSYKLFTRQVAIVDMTGSPRVPVSQIPEQLCGGDAIVEPVLIPDITSVIPMIDGAAFEGNGLAWVSGIGDGTGSAAVTNPVKARTSAQVATGLQQALASKAAVTGYAFPVLDRMLLVVFASQDGYLRGDSTDFYIALFGLLAAAAVLAAIFRLNANALHMSERVTGLQAEALVAAEAAHHKTITYASHMLRNPLTTIVGFMTMFRDKYEHLISEEDAADFQSTAIAASNAVRVIEDIEDYTAMSGGDVQLRVRGTNFETVLMSVLRDFSKTADAIRQTRWALKPLPSATVLIDALRFAQVLQAVLECLHKRTVDGDVTVLKDYDAVSDMIVISATGVTDVDVSAGMSSSDVDSVKVSIAPSRGHLTDTSTRLARRRSSSAGSSTARIVSLIQWLIRHVFRRGAPSTTAAIADAQSAAISSGPSVSLSQNSPTAVILAVSPSSPTSMKRAQSVRAAGTEGGASIGQRAAESFASGYKLPMAVKLAKLMQGQLTLSSTPIDAGGGAAGSAEGPPRFCTQFIFTLPFKPAAAHRSGGTSQHRSASAVTLHARSSIVGGTGYRFVVPQAGVLQNHVGAGDAPDADGSQPLPSGSVTSIGSDSRNNVSAIFEAGDLADASVANSGVFAANLTARTGGNGAVAVAVAPQQHRRTGSGSAPSPAVPSAAASTLGSIDPAATRDTATPSPASTGVGVLPHPRISKLLSVPSESSSNTHASASGVVARIPLSIDNAGSNLGAGVPPVAAHGGTRSRGSSTDRRIATPQPDLPADTDNGDVTARQALPIRSDDPSRPSEALEVGMQSKTRLHDVSPPPLHPPTSLQGVSLTAGSSAKPSPTALQRPLGLRILHADDEGTIRRQMVHMLQGKLGCEVVSVEDGDQVVAQLVAAGNLPGQSKAAPVLPGSVVQSPGTADGTAQPPEGVAPRPFDVLLLDIVMTRQHGDDLCRHLRLDLNLKSEQLPIIAVTSNCNGKDREKLLTPAGEPLPSNGTGTMHGQGAVGCGFDSVQPKPFMLDRMRALLQSVKSRQWKSSGSPKP